MASITDHVIKLQELTQQNLDILKAINDSFFTNQNHLSVEVGDSKYAIPSFISLENKLNSLTANFENLVNAPESGEAYFDFNGNSRAIQVRSYTSTPQSIVLNPVSEFGIDKNDIFKDFLTPCPYVNLNLQALPNDTTEVVVKKIIPLNTELKQLFKSQLIKDDTYYKPSVRYNYKDLYKVLDVYKEDIDYIEYDTRMSLPIRKNIGSGVYVIEEIIKDVVDENLENYITIKFRTDVDDPTCMNSLKYRLFDETIETNLKVGDQLITYEGNAKMEIIEIQPTTNTVVIKVLYGEFLNLVPSKTNEIEKISPLSKIKFYSPIDFDKDKYIKVPLEEDQYIFIAIAALNSRMNVQSPWGGGLMLNTYELKNEDKSFEYYYKENVRNVGDVLYEITALMSNTIMKYSKEEYNSFSNAVPNINTNNIKVVRINEHLNNSIAVQNIRLLHSQKSEVQSRLNEKIAEIDLINSILFNISFDDTTGQRESYQSQLTALISERNELMTALTKLTNEISAAANNSEVPIENAKYRIRGFFDIESEQWRDHIKGIRVQYRYKNIDKTEGQALTIRDKFVFSDWNEMPGSDRERIVNYIDGKYQVEITPENNNINEPSFNQIDIPISQGETVDIRLKLIYDFGAPFVQASSKWSDIVNIKFPEEYLKDIKILDIISENNNDIELNRFTNIINEKGIPEHINDKLTDQDITYYHKPENIASGFYTEERRIIPLKDKLSELNNMVIQLKDELLGTQNTELKVSFKYGNSSTQLTKYGHDYINTIDYAKFNETKELAGYKKDTNGVVSAVFYLSLLNDSDRSTKLYSMFPGDGNTILNGYHVGKFNINDYCNTNIGEIGETDKYKLIDYNGIWMELNHEWDINKPYKSSGSIITNWPCPAGYESAEDSNYIDDNKLITLQTRNQFLYFRNNSGYNTEKLYYADKDMGDSEFENIGQMDNKLSYGWTFNGVDDFKDAQTKKKNGVTNLMYKFAGNEFDTDNDGNKILKTLMYVYPKLVSDTGLSIDNDSNCLVINPKEEILIPIVVEFCCVENTENAENTEIQKTLSFDIWPSLYKEPINYTLTITAKYESTIDEQIIQTQQELMSTNSKYNIIYK